MVDLIAVNDPYQIMTTASAQYSSDVWQFSYDKTHQVKLPITFDRMIAYNSSQSTGTQPLTIKNPFDLDVTGFTYVRRTDNRWRINEFRDYSSANNSIWSSSWPDIQSSPFKWIDKVPANIDFTKSLFNSNRLSDYYLGLRLFFNPTENAKIVTDLIATVNVNKIR